MEFMDTSGRRRRVSHRSQWLASAAALALLAACSSSSGGPGPSTCAAPGGKVAGQADSHCMGNVPRAQPTDIAACSAVADNDGGGGDDAGSGDDAAAVVVEDGGGSMGNCDPALYGPTMYGQAGSDDDCKYDVEWSSSPVCEGGNGVTFTLTVHKRTDHSPLMGAAPYIEAVKDCLNGATGTPKTTDLGNGRYTIGPIVFPLSGRWVVRFHVFGMNCSDVLPTSPHGHAAFFVDVP